MNDQDFVNESNYYDSIEDLSQEDLEVLFPPDEDEDEERFFDDEYDIYEDEEFWDEVGEDGVWLDDEENWPDEWEKW